MLQTSERRNHQLAHLVTICKAVFWPGAFQIAYGFESSGVDKSEGALSCF